MHLPKLQLHINLDGYPIQDVQTVAAAKQERRLSYPEYSEFRDYIRSIFDDTSKYLLRGYTPSNKAKEDRLRLRGITLPSRKNKVDPYGPYRNQIDNYLKTPPVSQSFYLIAAVLGEDGQPVCDWEIFIRISNHGDSADSTSEDGIANKISFIGDAFRSGDTNFSLIPMWFTISCDVKVVDNVPTKTYQLDIIKERDKAEPIMKSSLSEVKQYVSDYIEDVRKQCLPSDTCPQDVAEATKITASRLSNKYQDVADTIIRDIEDAIIRFNLDLIETEEDSFEDYIWTCDYINIDGGEVTKVHILDNFGGSYIISCEFSVDEYLSNRQYRDAELYDICLALFDGYDWI